VSASLAMTASLLWGTSDYLGGRLSSRLPASTVVALSQFVAAVLMGGFVLATGGWTADAGHLGLAAGAGALWAVGIGAFYRALAEGTAGVVAPVASCGALVPVVVGLARGERPGALQALGVGIALVGVVCCGGPDVRPGPGRAVGPLLLAGVAALAFGGEVSLLAGVSGDSIPMTLLVMRLVAVVLVGGSVLAGRALVAPARADAALLAALGVLDVVAMLAYLLAARGSALSLVAVLASLYPAVTVLLARRLDVERLLKVQVFGVSATLAGAACLAAGGVSA